MKKFLVGTLALILVLSLFLSGCGGNKAADSGSDKPATKFSVVNIVNGNLGDKSFFDSAEAGLKQLSDAGVITYKTIELGGTDADQPKWLSTLYEVSDSKQYDVIICGTWQMNDYLTEVAPQYPNQKYVIYDAEVDQPNVLSLNYKQNETGYLIGVFAASLTTQTSFKNINADHVIGFVGGEDGPVINDFLAGYIQGALAADPAIKVDVRYTASYVDTAKGKELAQAMITQNHADIVWGVAGLSGNGAAEAAYENNAWFIGVDSDQEATFTGTQAPLAGVTLTSGLKNIGQSLVWVFNELEAGTPHWGEVQWLGLNLNGVGIVTDKNFKTVPQSVQDATLAAEDAVKNGTVTVGSAFGTNPVDI
ncbi:MAG: BMP family ABC transporter substrate-binding protein, partial [Firmicutes bacterium]|nr:BMP family ABC transporter substrate-binding protein [Bacillota bacterium]